MNADFEDADWVRVYEAREAGDSALMLGCRPLRVYLTH
jgi:hypothetical protein